MNIEPSLIVWTVLCFLALLVILKNLLFRPMLTFMDARREKIRAAREAKENAAREREEEISRRKAELAAEEARQREESAAAIEKVRTDTERTLSEKSAACRQKLDAYRAELDAESERICSTLEPELPGLAQNIVNHLQRWQDDSNSVVDADAVAAPYAAADVLRRQREAETN